MKSAILTFIFLLCCLPAFSQAVRKEVVNPDYAGKIFKNPEKAYGKIVGSPYSQRMFTSATVENINIKAYMRYNVFADEFEFISQKNDTLVLDKIEDFSIIFFPAFGKRYKLTPYTDSRNKLSFGYLIEVYKKGDFALLKKENISFVEEKVAKTTLEMTMPAKYNRSGDSYFLKNKEAGIAEFPNGKKALLKLFPEKKQQIEAYLKENKTSFDEEQDLIKLVDFLATI